MTHAASRPHCGLQLIGKQLAAHWVKPGEGQQHLAQLVQCQMVASGAHHHQLDVCGARAAAGAQLFARTGLDVVIDCRGGSGPSFERCTAAHMGLYTHMRSVKGPHRYLARVPTLDAQRGLAQRGSFPQVGGICCLLGGRFEPAQLLKHGGEVELHPRTVVIVPLGILRSGKGREGCTVWCGWRGRDRLKSPATAAKPVLTKAPAVHRSPGFTAAADCKRKQ